MDSMSKSLSFRCRIHIETITSLRCRNDMDSMSLRYVYDVKIVIILMSNPYGNDIAMALSFRYRFDIATIWIRHRNDMDSMSNPYGNDNVVTMSQRYGFDIV